MERLSIVGGEVSVFDTVIVFVLWCVCRDETRWMDLCHAMKNSRKTGKLSSSSYTPKRGGDKTRKREIDTG